MWPSWPQACILPGTRLRRSSGMSDSSVSGSASMSARRSTTGGAAADRGEDAGGGELLERHTHRRELALHDGRGCSLRPHQFGRQVELAADADDVVGHGRRVGEDRRGIERGGVAGRHGRRGRGGGIGARLGRRRHAGRDDERDREERERQPAKGGHLERTNGRARGRRARI